MFFKCAYESRTHPQSWQPASDCSMATERPQKSLILMATTLFTQENLFLAFIFEAGLAAQNSLLLSLHAVHAAG